MCVLLSTSNSFITHIYWYYIHRLCSKTIYNNIVLVDSHLFDWIIKNLSTFVGGVEKHLKYFFLSTKIFEI